MTRLSVAMTCLLMLAGCASTSPTRRESSQSAAEQRKSTMVRAMQSPMQDLNMRQVEIHPILLLAMADVYAMPVIVDCASLAEEVSALDRELGDDLDLRPFAGKQENFGVSVLAGAIKSLMPYRGIVRRLSGAEIRERRVAAAIAAGGIRRGYLKGLGESRNCASPAAPDRSAQARTPMVPVETLLGNQDMGD